MANTKTAKRQIRVQARKYFRNKAYRSAIKTAFRNACKKIEARSELSWQAVNRAIKLIDKAVNKGIIHQNKAARKKSRLMKKFNYFISPPQHTG